MLPKRLFPTLVFLLFFMIPGMLHAHGVFHRIERQEAVVIVAEFDDGEPMSYADVKVHSPAGGKIEYQNGRTDRNGYFAFIPDGPGNWRITVDAGMGHLVDATIAVNESLHAEGKENVGKPYSRWQGIVTGIGFIFGLTGFIYYLRARKSPPGSVKRDHAL